MIYSLAFLTLQECGPLEAIRAAAAAGYQRVGLRLLPATEDERDYPLLTDNRLLADVLALLDDTGLCVGEVELVRLKPETRVEVFERFFSRAAQLGARHVIAVNDDPARSRFIDNFSWLCERAAAHGLTVDLEPMPWTATTNLAQARAWIAEVGRDNAGILVDALHFHRGGSQLEDLRSIPDRQLNVFQICDAPLQFGSNHDDLRRVSRGERLLPGKGELDLLTLVERIPAHAIISVEVPSVRDALRFSAQERAIRALRAAREIFGKALGGGRGQ